MDINMQNKIEKVLLTSDILDLFESIEDFWDDIDDIEDETANTLHIL